MASATTTISSSIPSITSYPVNHPRRFSTSQTNFRRTVPSISAVYTTTKTEVTTTSLQKASFYEVLGIQAGASGKEIKAAYRKLARVLHPDATVGSNEQKDPDEFIRVHEAYATLSDPKKRADYDRMMWVKGRRLSYSPTYCTMGSTKYTTSSCSGFSGYTRRTWETDQCW